MHMDFRVYQLTYAGDLKEKGESLYGYLRDHAKIPGEHGFDFCITREIDFDENIITGCLSEEHPPNINSVDEDKNVYTPDVAPYMNTFFSIDLQEKRMLVQHRDYPANNLNRTQSMTRLRLLLNAAFQNVYHSEFNAIHTKRNVTDEDFIDAFNNYRVSKLRVKLFEKGRLLGTDNEIFEDKIVNKAWIQGWNSDESNMHEIILQAPGRGGDGDLRYSPIARTLWQLPVKEILEMNYWNESGGSETMSRTDFKKFRIRGINKDTQPITAIDAICSDVYSRRDEIREFKIIDELK